MKNEEKLAVLDPLLDVSKSCNKLITRERLIVLARALKTTFYLPQKPSLQRSMFSIIPSIAPSLLLTGNASLISG